MQGLGRPGESRDSMFGEGDMVYFLDRTATSCGQEESRAVIGLGVVDDPVNFIIRPTNYLGLAVSGLSSEGKERVIAGLTPDSVFSEEEVSEIAGGHLIAALSGLMGTQERLDYLERLSWDFEREVIRRAAKRCSFLTGDFEDQAAAL